MERVLQHTLVGLVCGAGAALGLIVVGTGLMLAPLFMSISYDAGWVIMALCASCYGMAPIAGAVAFLLGLVASVVVRPAMSRKLAQRASGA